MNNYILSHYNITDLNRVLHQPSRDRFLCWNYSTVERSEIINKTFCITELNLQDFFLIALSDIKMIEKMNQAAKNVNINTLDPVLSDFLNVVELHFPSKSGLIGFALMAALYQIIEARR